MGQQSKRSVVVVGPNLPQQAKATFHVHAEGCADLKRGWIRRYADESMSFDVTSRYDVEAEVYDFAPAESEGYVLGAWQSEFHFAPCLDDLPLEAAPAKLPVTAEQGDLLREIGDAADTVRRYAAELSAEASRILRDVNEGRTVFGHGTSMIYVTEWQGKLDALVQVAARTFKGDEYREVVVAVIAAGRSSVRSLVELDEAKA